MATGNPTPNAGLNQWQLSDKIKMDEFNADNQKVDSAIGALKKTALPAGGLPGQVVTPKEGGGYGWRAPLKTGYIYQGTADPSLISWHKVASCTIPTSNSGASLSCLITKPWAPTSNNEHEAIGLLHIYTDTNPGNTTVAHSSIHWGVVSKFDPNDFILAYSNDATLPITVELWIRAKVTHSQFIITVLSESGEGRNVNTPFWTVYESRSPVSAPTPGYTQIVSQLPAPDHNLRAAMQIADRTYQGEDLTQRFAFEIAAAPYNGNAWAWVQARIKAANWDGIHIGDYIPFVAGGNNIKAEVAGIDTYYRYGDTPVPHHIDFISRDCWPEAHAYNKADYNNGTSVSPHPWLASDLKLWLNSEAGNVPNSVTANPALVAVDYSTTGVYDKLPAALKAVIIPKRALLPQRYTAGSVPKSDNAWSWGDAGKLWIPSEVEVCDMEHWGSKNGFSGGGFQQYPVFATNMKRIKGASDGGTRIPWWLLSSLGNSSISCVCIGGIGSSNSNNSSSELRVPLCFRIA